MDAKRRTGISEERVTWNVTHSDAARGTTAKDEREFSLVHER